MREHTFINTDPVVPVEIEHKVDELFTNGVLQQRYNFIDYHFEVDGAYCRARAYLDSIESVAIYGPFKARTSLSPVESPQFLEDVLSYLKRRFHEIKALGAEGYELLWPLPADPSP